MPDMDPAAVVDASNSSSTVSPDRPPIDERISRSIADHNPFFLLSALCMLGGSVAITNSLSWSPVRLERILLLTATINVYEMLLVGLGVALLRRPASRRDGALLLILEAFFLVDVAFLNAELFAIDRWVGLMANVTLFVLALAKLSYIGHALRIPIGELAVATATIFLVDALPGGLKFYATSRGGTLPPLAMLITWWAIFAVGVGIHAALSRRPLASRFSSGLASWFAPMLTMLAGVSLLAHAGTGQWIYDLHFWGADLAPVFALAAFMLCSHRFTRAPGVLCALAALFASASYDSRFVLTHLGITLTPVHVTVGIVYITLAWTLARKFFGWLMGIGLSATIIAIFGPSLVTIRQWLAWTLGQADDAFEHIRPKTQTHWGIISVVMSFALLAVGAIFSLRRDPPRVVVPQTS